MNTDKDLDFSKLSESFQAMLNDKDMFFQFLDMFPYMILVYAPDGTSLFINRAGCKEMNIASQDDFVGRHNVHHDPMIDLLGFRDVINRVFQGGTDAAYDIRVPYEDISERYDQEDEDFSQVKYMDISGFPLWNEKKEIAYVIALFIVRRVYTGRSDIIKVKEYIESNWREAFNAEDVAKAVHMSVSQLKNLFKLHTGMTLNDYHQKCMVGHIKEKLADKKLSVKEVFAACGEDSQSWFAKVVFKNIVGMNPTEYRNSLK
jgi:AraC-like DNA-binding protein